ncbi:unnamed protein product [Dracunculus medinensis]|uniref:Alpha-carbonic anhydrase domain-containing protein n=1 Tax=Dracunculus medinensis TaxID=318479 RepID=A0A0N4UHW6_DRAME|nr:unnamed protein product [Dracunculus medinensis]
MDFHAWLARIQLQFFNKFFAFSALKGDHLKFTYKFKELHGHWGNCKDYGSEHLMNGKAFSAEFHFVCWNEKYATAAECFKHCDGIAVLALFFQESNDNNPHLEPLINGIKEAANTKNSANISNSFDPSKLLPDDLNYYTYNGSLTTPDYHECVTWTVLRKATSIGRSQVMYQFNMY